MNDKLVTIRTFYFHHETLLYGSRLADEDIYYFLKDQSTVTIDPLVSNAIGGIKLQVKLSDAERALEIIKELDLQHKSTEEPKEIKLGRSTYEHILEECPQCESDEVFKEKLSFVQSFTRLFKKKRYYCGACKHEWEWRYEE